MSAASCTPVCTKPSKSIWKISPTAAASARDTRRHTCTDTCPHAHVPTSARTWACASALSLTLWHHTCNGNSNIILRFFQEEIPEQSHRAAQRGIQTLFPHAGSRWLAVCACTIINFIFFITMCLNSFALSSNRLFCLFSCEYLNFFPLRVLTQSFTVRMSVLFSFSLIIALFSCTYPIFLSGAMLTWSSVL